MNNNNGYLQKYNQFHNNNNFNEVFLQNNNIIDTPNFINNGNLIHNNIDRHLLNEYISEYTIHIDSLNRNFDVFSNPFNFTVTFGGIGQTINKRIHNNGNIESTLCSGQPDPKISRKFKNVKYIKLNHVILPRTNLIELITGLDDNIEYSLGDSTSDLINYKYLILKIKNLGNNRLFSTNDAIDFDCYILHPDKILGSNNYMWLPTQPIRVFQNSSLSNLDKMIFELQDDEGHLLYVIDASGNVLFTNSILNNLIDTKIATDPILLNFKRIHKIMQMEMELTIGVVENELNTNTKYES